MHWAIYLLILLVIGLYTTAHVLATKQAHYSGIERYSAELYSDGLTNVTVSDIQCNIIHRPTYLYLMNE